MSSLTWAACLFWIVSQQNATKTPAPKPGREYFISWGYNGDRYSSSDLHISQPSLGNDFTLVSVQARDSKAWTELFNHSLFVPQYNIRGGMFLNEKWGFEIALDHFKWIVRQDQSVRVTGTLNNAPVDSRLTLTTDVLKYQLNNGANPVFFNVLRRVRLRGEPTHTGSMFILGKAGGGFAVPHTENTLFGQPNDKGFQPFHGWDLDAAAAFRIHVFKPVYVELEEKLLYARYFGVKVDQGTAHHSVKNAEFSFHFGVAIR
jgi:hypothetical protein